MTKFEEEIIAAWRAAEENNPLLNELDTAHIAADISNKHIEAERRRIWTYLRDRAVNAGKDHGDMVHMEHIARATNGLQE